MKTPDPLDDLLQTWNPPSDVPPDLSRQVWLRIADTADVDGNTTLRPLRTRLAALAAAAVVVAGFGLGLLSGGNATDRDRAAYFTRIDPIAQAR